MNTTLTVFLQYVGYVGIAALAVLSNHFYGIPDTQLTTSIVASLLTVLGAIKLQAAGTGPLKSLSVPATSSDTANTAVSAGSSSSHALPITEDLQKQ